MAFLFVVHVPYTPKEEKIRLAKYLESEGSPDNEVQTDAKDTDVQTDAKDTDVQTDAKDTDVQTDAKDTDVQTDAKDTDVGTHSSDETETQLDKTEVENERAETADDSIADTLVDAKEQDLSSEGKLQKEEDADTKIESKHDDLVSKTELQTGDSEAKDEKEDEGKIAAVTDTEKVVSEPKPAGFDDDKVSQSSKTGSPSKTSESGDEKEKETVKGTTKTFDIVPVEDSEINIDADAMENGSNPKDSRDDDDKKNAEEKEDELTADKDHGEDGGGDKKTMNDIDEKHLTPLIEIDPMHKAVLKVLKDCQVENVVQEITENPKLMRISFVKEDSKNCEGILNELKALDVGVIPGSSISVFPTSVHESYTDDASTEASTPTDEKEPSLAAQEKEKDSKFKKFKKTVKSRLIVQQVVDSIRGNAEFTFDYVLLVILASAIACMGLVENSSVVLVASMLISPLMGPILAGTFGHVIKKYELRNLGIKSEIKGLFLCVLFGFLFGLIAGGFGLNGAVWGSSDSWPTIEMKSRGMLRSLWVGVLIAIPSGAGVAIGILGGNAGSLVGVAISASLLPPAVNAGMLWAYGLLTAIKPPDVILNSVITTPTTEIPTTTSSANITTTLSNVTGMGNFTTPFTTTSTTSLPPLIGIPESCLPLVNNAYRPVYSCNISHDAALLGLVSLFLTVINIVLIFFMGIGVLWIKEVAPYDAGTRTANSFWHEDVKVARDYNQTSKGREAMTLGQNILKEWKQFQADRSKGISEDQRELQQRVGVVECIDYISNLENDPGVARLFSRISPSDTRLGLTDEVMLEYQAAKDHVDEQYRKDPSIYLARPQHKARNQKVEKAYHTVHNVEVEERKPSIAELRNRFTKGRSLYLDLKSESDLDIPATNKKKTRNSFALLSPTQNKLFKRRKVKFQDADAEEGENLV